MAGVTKAGPGHLRRTEVIVMGYDCPPHDDVMLLMREFFDWAQAEDDLHPIHRAALLQVCKDSSLRRWKREDDSSPHELRNAEIRLSTNSYSDILES